MGLFDALLLIGAGVTALGMNTIYKEKYSKYSDNELVDEYYKLQTLHNDENIDGDDEIKLTVLKQIMRERHLL